MSFIPAAKRPSWTIFRDDVLFGKDWVNEKTGWKKQKPTMWALFWNESDLNVYT